MDILDWLMAAAFVALLGYAFYALLPPWGVLIGVAMGTFLMFQAKKRRDSLKKKKE